MSRCLFFFSEPVEGLQPISPQFFDTFLYQMKFELKYQRKPQNQTFDLFSHIEPPGWQPRVPGDMAPKREPEKEALEAAAPGSLECIYGIIYISYPVWLGFIIVVWVVEGIIFLPLVRGFMKYPINMESLLTNQDSMDFFFRSSNENKWISL